MLKDILRLEQLSDFATDKTCHQFYYANAELHLYRIESGFQEQDESSDTEQQPPFGDRK